MILNNSLCDMKSLLICSILFLCQWVAFGEKEGAEGPRAWTDEKSGRVIHATLVDKKPDDSSALLRMKDGKEVWIAASRLIADDREWIKKWTKPFQYLTLKKIKDDSGQVTTVVVKVMAKDDPIAVVAKPIAADGNQLTFEFYKLEPGETKEFELDATIAHHIKVSDTEGKVLVEDSYKP
jgi:hypothetical protein